jgi:hypothetical protein
LKILDNKDAQKNKKFVVDLRNLTPSEQQAVYRTIMRVVKKVPSDYSLFVSKKTQNL